jgi:hypothetical protein
VELALYRRKFLVFCNDELLSFLKMNVHTKILVLMRMCSLKKYVKSSVTASTICIALERAFASASAIPCASTSFFLYDSLS